MPGAATRTCPADDGVLWLGHVPRHDMPAMMPPTLAKAYLEKQGLQVMRHTPALAWLADEGCIVALTACGEVRALHSI